MILMEWAKDSNVQIEREGKEYVLHIIYPSRYETFRTTRKAEAESILSKLEKEGLKIGKWKE